MAQDYFLINFQVKEEDFLSFSRDTLFEKNKKKPGVSDADAAANGGGLFRICKRNRIDRKKIVALHENVAAAEI